MTERAEPSFEQRTAEARRSLPTGPAVGVLGSSSLHHPQSEATCRALGRALADVPELVLITGGVAGVGEAIGRSFFARRQERGQAARVCHLLPPGYPCWDYGQNLVVEDTMMDRREVLARIARVYLVVEGGPGTEHEARVAQEQGAILIPIGRSGGHAEALYTRIECPPFANPAAWHVLGASDAHPADVAAAACTLAAGALPR